MTSNTRDRVRWTVHKKMRSIGNTQNGFFEFTDLDADKYVIKAKKKRHRPAKKTVEIKEGESKKIEIELRRISNIRILSKRH